MQLEDRHDGPSALGDAALGDDGLDGHDLAPEERIKAAAQILARGIRRLLTRTAPPGAKAPLPAREGRFEPPAPSPQPAENTEKVALPGVPSRALMGTKAG